MALEFSVQALGDPTERRTWIPAYSVILLVASSFFVSVRIISRLLKTTGTFGLDDVLLIFAWIFGAAFTIMFTVGALYYGYDRHTSAFNSHMAVKAGLLGWLGELFYLLSSNCTKLVVLLFYRRLLPSGIRRGLLIAIYVSIGLTVAYAIAFILPVFFECNPLEARWMQFDLAWVESHPSFHCTSRDVIVPLSGALSVFGDVYALVIPLMIVWDLKMPRRQKLALYSVFGFGITVVVAGIVRTIYLDKANTATDVSWLAANAVIASDAEIHLAMICASAPAARALFRRFIHDPVSKFTSHSTDRSWGGGFEGGWKKPRFNTGSSDTTKTWSTWSTWSHGLKSGLSTSCTTNRNASVDTDREVILKDLKPVKFMPTRRPTPEPMPRGESPPPEAEEQLKRSKYLSHKSFGETHEFGITQSREISVAYEPLVPEVPPLPAVQLCSCGVWHAPNEDHWSGFSSVRF